MLFIFIENHWGGPPLLKSGSSVVPLFRMILYFASSWINYIKNESESNWRVFFYMLEDSLKIIVDMTSTHFWKSRFPKCSYREFVLGMLKKCVFRFFINRRRECVFQNQRAKWRRMVVELSELDRFLYYFLIFEIWWLFLGNLGVSLSATHLFIFDGFYCSAYLAPKIAPRQLFFTLNPPGLLITGRG